MAEKGETKTDISSTDESDYMKLYKKKNQNCYWTAVILLHLAPCILV